MRWNQISAEARDLIIKLIKVNESERITLEEVLHHPWMLDNFKGVDNSKLRRTDSEETLVEEEDDAIVINDDEFQNENRDETRSIDDSSSGIVMSDRNEGSSVSHEEIDPNGHIIFENNDEEMPTMPMVEEQIEPENLSLKAEKKSLEDEPTVVVPIEEEIPVQIIQKSPPKSRTPKKTRSRAVKQKTVKQELLEISPLDLHTPKADSEMHSGLPLNLVVEIKEEFLGFNRLKVEDDDNFPCFGFAKSETLDIMSNTLMLYKQLFEKKISNENTGNNNKVLTVVKAKRVRKNNLMTAQSQIELPRIQVFKMLPTKCASLPDVQPIKKTRAAKREYAPALLPPPLSSSRPIRACRVLKEAQKAAEIQKQTKKVVVEKPSEVKKSRAPKRPNKNTENEVPSKRSRRNIKQEMIEPSPVITFAQVNEIVKKPRGRKKVNEAAALMPPPPPPQTTARSRAQKRKLVEPEPPKKTVAEKKPRKTPAMIKKEPVESSRKGRMTRKQQNILWAKQAADAEAAAQPHVGILERLNLKPKVKSEHPTSDVISYLQRPAQNLSPKFKERLFSVKSTYVDNREQPSLIPTRFAKPEPVEKSTINFSSQPLRTQYR